MNAGLGERKQQILYAVVSDYIATAQPVGSLQIAEKKSIHLSPATIRAVMAELEERGFLNRAHSSSGRTPTDAAYRVYVDQLLKLRTPSSKDKELLKSKLLQTLTNINNLPRDSSRVLSDLVHNAGLVTYPKPDDRHLGHIQLYKLKGKLVLVILVSSTGLVENKILKLSKNLKQTELNHMHNYLNETLKGLTVAEARRKILQEIENEKKKYDALIQAALAISQQALLGSEDTLHIDGQRHLLGIRDFVDYKEMQKTLEKLEEKTFLATILEDCLKSPGVKILIGEEFKAPEINGLTMITAPYTDSDGNKGLLGVIGPTRVDYARVVPLVEYTSNLISKVLKESK